MNTKHPRIWRVVQVLAAIYVVLWWVVGFYANHSFPHGPAIHTGEYECANDGRGPCGEVTVEDTRGLDVPDWVRFMRDKDSELLLAMIAAWILAAYASDKLKKEV